MSRHWEERLEIIEDSLKVYFKKKNERWGEAGFMRLLDVNKGRFTQIFKRRGMMYLDEAGKICNMLNINPEWLMGISENMLPVNPCCAMEDQTQVYTQNTEVGELVIKMVDIMTSDSSYRNALSDDIRLYHKKLDALKSERRKAAADHQPEICFPLPKNDGRISVNKNKIFLTPE